jgi:hypothetical protein
MFMREDNNPDQRDQNLRIQTLRAIAVITPNLSSIVDQVQARGTPVGKRP